MTDFVRVKLENGSEASVSAEFAELLDLKPLEKPAARGGVALPAKHNPLKKKSGASAAADTEEKK
jgi:hypothetical protein